VFLGFGKERETLGTPLKILLNEIYDFIRLSYHFINELLDMMHLPTKL
jgi:hypothetical protein